MSAHINASGEFQSDKYPECPAGKVPLSVHDETAQDLLWEYAQRRRSVDAEFSADLETCLRAAGYVPPQSRSVQPEWCKNLPVQQQSVLFLAGRGPDGTVKGHPCKNVHIAYRGCVFLAGKYGRPLEWGEHADSFMSLDRFASDVWWPEDVKAFFDHNGELAHHYLLHFYHGTEILGYKHPDVRFRRRWHAFYLKACEALHLNPETEAQMDERLGDWGKKKHWRMV